MPPSLQPEPDPAPGLDLEALRERLRAARSERGACPPWEELRADLLPTGGGRAGREARLAHRELCPYCDAHVREWERSFDKTSDALQAVETHIARGVFEGARRLISLGGTRGAEDPTPAPLPTPAPFDSPTPPPRYDAPTYPGPTFAAQTIATPPPPPPPAPIAAPRMYTPPSERQERQDRQEREYREERQERPERPARSEPPAPRPTPTPPPAAAPPPPAPSAGLRLLVVEATAVERIPPSVFLCAQVLGAEVAQVGSIDELAGDPDLDAVCGIVFAGARPAAEWPEALHRGRDLAPGRPVLILTGGGALPKGSTSRALRDALLSIDDPAELLLLALDPRLR